MKLPKSLLESREIKDILIRLASDTLHLDKQIRSQLGNALVEIMKEAAKIGERLDPIAKKHCQLNEFGRLKKNPNGSLVFASNQHLEVFLNESNHLFDGEFEIGISPISRSDLKDVTISEKELQLLSPLLEEKDGPTKTT